MSDFPIVHVDIDMSKCPNGAEQVFVFYSASEVFPRLSRTDQSVMTCSPVLQEFMLASQMSDVSEKLRVAFKMYDEDGSGTIDRGEMVDIVTNLYASQGVAKVQSNGDF